VDLQWTWKEDRRMKRLLSNAKLKINACVEDIVKGSSLRLTFVNQSVSRCCKTNFNPYRKQQDNSA
jgi:hypothetical protein